MDQRGGDKEGIRLGRIYGNTIVVIKDCGYYDYRHYHHHHRYRYRRHCCRRYQL